MFIRFLTEAIRSMQKAILKNKSTKDAAINEMLYGS